MMPRPGLLKPELLKSGLLHPALLGFFLFLAVESHAGVSLPQSDGSQLALESPAQRVITLAPHLAEMMFDAGAGDALIATVEYSNFPEQATRLPRIGDAFRFDLERIMALQPDLIIAWSSGNPASALDRLDSLGFKVWKTELRQPMDIALLLENIAIATGTGETGKDAARKVETRLGDLARQYSGKTEIHYFYQVSERPLFTLNGQHIVSQGLSLCGGVNVFADESTLAPQISREAVLQADPDVFFAPRLPESADPLEHWQSWPRLTAVHKQAMYSLPADKISRATPRMLDSLELACTLLDQNRAQNAQPRESS